MKTTWRVTNITQGRLSVPGQREPLAFGGFIDYLGDLPEVVKGFIGQRLVTAVQITVKKVKKETPPAASVKTADPVSKPTTSKKKDSDI